MKLEEIWDKLDGLHLALGETLSENTKLPRNHVLACLAKYGPHQVDDGCGNPDCPTCDALSYMVELLQVDRNPVNVDHFNMAEVIEMMEGRRCVVTIEGVEYQHRLLVDPSGMVWVQGQLLERSQIGCFELIDDGSDDEIWKIHYFATEAEAKIERDSRGGNLVDASLEV